jgi:hypothetical protein
MAKKDKTLPRTAREGLPTCLSICHETRYNNTANKAHVKSGELLILNHNNDTKKP